VTVHTVPLSHARHVTQYAYDHQRESMSPGRRVASRTPVTGYKTEVYARRTLRLNAGGLGSLIAFRTRLYAYDVTRRPEQLAPSWHGLSINV
jgi:hypothetical protein